MCRMSCLAGKGVQLVKRKKTMHPEWNTSFDFHLYEGRVIHMEIIQRPDIKVAECSILAQSLADMAMDGEPASVWVIYSALCTRRAIMRNKITKVKYKICHFYYYYYFF